MEQFNLEVEHGDHRGWRNVFTCHVSQDEIECAARTPRVGHVESEPLCRSRREGRMTLEVSKPKLNSRF